MQIASMKRKFNVLLGNSFSSLSHIQEGVRKRSDLSPDIFFDIFIFDIRQTENTVLATQTLRLMTQLYYYLSLILFLFSDAS